MKFLVAMLIVRWIINLLYKAYHQKGETIKTAWDAKHPAEFDLRKEWFEFREED